MQVSLSYQFRDSSSWRLNPCRLYQFKSIHFIKHQQEFSVSTDYLLRLPSECLHVTLNNVNQLRPIIIFKDKKLLSEMYLSVQFIYPEIMDQVTLYTLCNPEYFYNLTLFYVPNRYFCVYLLLTPTQFYCPNEH